MLEYRAMTEGDLDLIMAIEEVIYTHPWTRGNFTDTLRAGGHGWIMTLSGVPVGYAVLSTGAGEAHLLNISVAAAWQRRGFGCELLAYVIERACVMEFSAIFLEVRASNTGALALYCKMGFTRIGVRKGYYPAPVGREDAIVLQYQP